MYLYLKIKEKRRQRIKYTNMKYSSDFETTLKYFMLNKIVVTTMIFTKLKCTSQTIGMCADLLTSLFM